MGPGPPATMGATNNEMELEAPIEALSLVRKGALSVDLTRLNKIVIRTDSMYVFSNVPNAISIWRKTRWTKKGGAAVSPIESANHR
ncbi:MAG TPA: RNase H family protein [Candidatus Dormibacteraeota bacterium]|nr:RNase H family protein [Candidatus Dormibacteraeota bacterium]